MITSPQFLCNAICRPYAANGGYPFPHIHAFEWIKQNGIELEKASQPRLTIKDFEYYATLEACQLKELIKKQPVVATIFITEEFRNLKNTIYEGPEEKDLVRTPPRSNVVDPIQKARDYQTILVIGFGEKDDEDYFLIQNSWGEDWGEEGYAKVRFKIETSTGTEYLLKNFAFPVLSV